MTGIGKPIFGTLLNRDHPLAHGLVASYLFNETRGRTAYDSSGTENHGAMTGFGSDDTTTAGWVPGPDGGAIATPGTDGNIYVDCGNAPSLQLSTGTVTCNLYAPTPGIDWRGVAMKYLAYGIYLYWGRIVMYDFGTGGIYDTHIQVDDGLPHTIAFTFESGLANGSCIYLDGKCLLRYTMSINSQTTPLLIGSGYVSYYNICATYSSANVYSRVLSSEELSYLSAFPYCMYDQDELYYSKVFDQKFYRQLMAGGY